MKNHSIPTFLIGASLTLIPAAMFAQIQPNLAPGTSLALRAVLAQDKTEAGLKGANPVGYRNPSAPDSNGFSAMDKHFLKEAAEGGMAEVKLGQLAADKGGTDAVKDFGQKMVHDHTELNEQMKPFIEKAGVTAPTSLSTKDQALYDRLNGLHGAAFDSAYISSMVKDHTKDKMDFTKEASSTKNEDLRDAVKHGDQVIGEHLKMAHELSATHGKSDTPAS